MKALILSFTVLLFTSCSQTGEQKTEDASLEPVPETISFLGKPLYAKSIDPLVMAKADSVIQAIRSKDDLTEEDYIAIGRQLTSTGRFRATVENFTEGLNKFPNSFKLYRHRGHRYLNLRELDNSIADLSKAEELIRTEPETWEYDGSGNPTATYQHQIWYHIGLYHFLNRTYAESATAYEKSLALAQEGDDIAGASAWLYNAYQRSGQQEKIPAILEPFTLDFDIDDKDYSYFRRMLLYNGVISPEELVDASQPIEALSLGDVSLLNGLANWYGYNGDSLRANELHKKVSQSSEWAGFAVACAELDVVE